MISSSANADDLNNMYGLGVLETAAGDEETNSDSDSYIELMLGNGSLNDSTVKNLAGANLGEAKFDKGLSGSVSYGTEFMEPLLWEVELGYNENDVESAPANTVEGNLKAYSAMVNLLLEVDFLPIVEPYIGAGAGYAHIADDESSDNVLAYQAIGGLEFEVINDISLVAEYKYMRADDVEFDKAGNNGQFDYIDQNIEVGVRLGL